MSIKMTQAALNDKKQLSEEEWEEIKSKIKSATDNLTHKDLKLVPNPFLEHPIWQLTVDESKTNHRVYIDVRNSKVTVIAIWNFEFTHNGDKHWKELENRIK